MSRNGLRALVGASVLGVAVWVTLGLVACAAFASPPGTRTAHVRACAEDDACWVWSRMGNRQRGVYVARKHGVRHVVVGPCRFAHLAKRGKLDSTTPHLRGDAWAIRHGCVPRHA